jgi:replicative DNA helicase
MWLLGAHGGQLMLVGGTTGAAKTGFLERLALNMAGFGVPVTFAQLELTEQRQRERFLAKLHGCSVRGFYNDLRSELDEYVDGARNTIEKLDVLPLHILSPEGDASLGARACFEAAWRNGSRALFIDHARELAGWLDGRTADGKHAASAAAEQIIRLTRRSGLAVIVAHQLAVDPMHVRKRPVKEQFMDTKMLAQKADSVVLVHRPFRGLGYEDRVAELIIDKNRNGPEGVIHAHFLPGSIDFARMSPEEAFRAPCCVATNEKRAKALAEAARGQ